jgi:hypothetical protein
MAAKKKTGSTGSASVLRNVVGSGVAADTLIDLVEKLGLVDLVMGRMKARLEDTDIDELMDEVADYLKRNPEVLVVSLGALTVAVGMLVWLNSRREWDGSERRGREEEETRPARVRATPGRVRRAS